MMRFQFWIISFLLVLVFCSHTNAQKKKTVTPQPQQAQKKTTSQAEDEKRVKDIVEFLQYMLNTLGSGSTSARDKEVLVKESYSKIFRDGKVQVEDDLDAERIVPINKDIVAYLKDVDFFFKNVKFEFAIEDTKSSTLPSGEIFYKVSGRRTLTGTSTEGKIVQNNIPRFIEINYDPASQDLRIVSMYTHEINETAILTNWWKDLSLEWKTLFLKKQFPSKKPMDSLVIADIKKITTIEDLDISDNAYLQNLEPIDRLHNLKFLDLSNTDITDLSPLRNLTELETLDLSQTEVADLSPLKYCNKLINLDISHTLITDVFVLGKMLDLQNLYMSRTPVNEFAPIGLLTTLTKADLSYTRISTLTPLQNLTNISSLNLSGAAIQTLDPLKNMKQLKSLDIDSTQIKNLEPLSNSENLEVLHANYTPIADLLPLQNLKTLQTIYADYTGIDRVAADKFLALNPNVKIIFDSDNLQSWWSTLSPEWKSVFTKTAKTTATPSKIELAGIAHIDSINIRGLSRMQNLEPLRKLFNLKIIIANNTAIANIEPLKEHDEITYLDISDTEVSDISSLSKFTKLNVLRADRSKIENLETLTLPSLKFVYADQTSLHDITAREFLVKNPTCLVIYKTNHLKRWWNDLSENWKTVFITQMESDTTREGFHKLVEQKRFQFKDQRVTDLNAFSEFVQLTELDFSGTAITTISHVESLQSLTSLHATNSPIQKIESPGLPATLQDLDISNTPISDLSDLGNLPNLKRMNCSGTQIKRLNSLENSQVLEHLDCSNTNVSKLSPLDNLPLKTLTCYNTKISNREIDNFKARHPECNVVYYR